MSTKNVYLFKVIIRNAQTNAELPVSSYKGMFREIFERRCRNQAIMLTRDDTEPIMMDILEDTDEYLFARLNRKRLNNNLQKRNYDSFLTEDVLPPDEVGSNGVELFTYCILGYSHGILSIVNARGAPDENALGRLFARYNHDFYLDTESIPNQAMIQELLDGRSPEINRVQIAMAQPNAQILQEIFGFSDGEVLQEIARGTSSIVFDVKPNFRRALSKDPGVITSVIQTLRQNRGQYHSVIISGKRNSNERQRSYDLYEEYFKYPIDIREYRQENGRKVERGKEQVRRDYRREMMNIYNQYKEVILAVCDR